MRLTSVSGAINWRWGLLVLTVVTALMVLGRLIQLPPGVY